METRANYILIGAFTLLGFVGLLLFSLWFARVELDRQFDYYDIRFSSVSGLARASDVRFAGLPVGQVVDVGLSPNGDGTVTVRIEVSSDTPVRADSIATIESQGVTGVSFVGLSAGTPEAPLLARRPGDPVPRIESGRSVLQSLSEDAPEILAEVLSVAQQLGELLGPENQRRVDTILTNVEGASGSFAQAIEDLADVTGSVSGFAEQIERFNATLEELSGAMTVVLASADSTLAAITELSDETRSTMEIGGETLTEARGVIAGAERFLAEDLTVAVGEVTATVSELRGQVEALAADTRAMIGEFTTTGATATARLTEAEATLAAADAMIARLSDTLGTVDRAAARLDTLLEGDGSALLAEARVAVAEATATIRAIGETAETDLPAIVADVRGATETAARVIEEVGRDLSSASGRIDGLAERAETALAGVTETFANANETLGAINAALDTGERTLAAAERAFAGADRVINEEVAGITEDLRATLARLDGAVGQVSEDIPALTADLRAAGEQARAAFEEFGRLVSTSGPQLREFASTGLPQYTRLAQETRTLIANLESLTRQIQRDPARFFLNRQTPEFRR